MSTPVCFVIAGGTTYSFPSVSVTWDVTHQLLEIPIPKTLSPELTAEVGAIVKSLNIVTEGFRLVGNWYNSESETSLARAQAFVNYFKTNPEPAVFSYETITANVFLKESHFDIVPGEGGIKRYNIVLSAERAEVD